MSQSVSHLSCLSPCWSLLVSACLLAHIAEPMFPCHWSQTSLHDAGSYYATEDMVGPSYGTTTLEDFFKDVAENGLQVCQAPDLNNKPPEKKQKSCKSTSDREFISHDNTNLIYCFSTLPSCMLYAVMLDLMAFSFCPHHNPSHP